MRLAYFNYHHDLAGQTQGAAVQIANLARELQALGHEVAVCSWAAGAAGASRAPEGLKQISWLRRYGHFPRLLCRNFSLYRREVAFLRQFRPAVVLAVSSYGNLSAVWSARRLRLPLVLFCEAPLAYEYALFQPQYHPYYALGRYLEGYAIRRAARVICISEILKGYLLPYGGPANKFLVCPNGVDAAAFRPQPPDPELLRRLGLGGKIVLGFVGSFQFFAAQEAIGRILQELCQRHPEVAMLWIGGGTTAAHWRQRLADLGLSRAAIFPGLLPHEEVPRYLSLVDLGLCFYRGDYLFYGSSMKLLEYMAAGKAVIAPALGQIKELIHDGCNGWLYAPDAWPELAAKLELAVSDPARRQQLGEKARETILTGWTWAHQARKVAQALAEAVAGA